MPFGAWTGVAGFEPHPTRRLSNRKGQTLHVLGVVGIEG